MNHVRTESREQMDAASGWRSIPGLVADQRMNGRGVRLVLIEQIKREYVLSKVRCAIFGIQCRNFQINKKLATTFRGYVDIVSVRYFPRLLSHVQSGRKDNPQRCGERSAASSSCGKCDSSEAANIMQAVLQRYEMSFAMWLDTRCY